MKVASKIFVISGPSGAGKTSILQRLFRRKFVRKNFSKSISYTTRPRRPGERGGRDYFFTSRQDFLKLMKKDFFLETQKVLDDYYGTPYVLYRQACRRKKDLILCIDVKGGKYLKNTFKKDKIISVFIAPPQEKELCRRMKKRGETKNTIGKRIKLAKKELAYMRYYDYIVVNDQIEESVDNVEAILRAEQLRRCR